MDLLGKTIWIEDRGIKILRNDIIQNPRIGIDYAGADALLPYRFTVKT
jgi:DNA-3-methyladenine glycosylase